MGSTEDATRDGPIVPCFCTAAFGNVWYSFEIRETSVVYFDTAGSSFDTSLFITNSAGTPVPGQATNGFGEAGLCNDDANCNGGDWSSRLESRTVGRFGPDTYFVSVGGCGTGAFTLHAQVMEDVGSFVWTGRLAGMGLTSTELTGTNAVAGTCGGQASGEDQRWFMSCGGQRQFFSLCRSDMGTWTRRIATTNFDPAMYIRSAQSGMQVVCNDDGGSMGGTDCTGTGGDSLPWGPRIDDVETPRGVSAIFVDERTGGTGMQYTMRYIIR